MQSFIKIRGAVLEKNADKIMTLCNFNKDKDNVCFDLRLLRDFKVFEIDV